MSAADYRRACELLREKSHQTVLTERIKSGSCLVHYDDIGLMQEYPRKGQALLFAARKRFIPWAFFMQAPDLATLRSQAEVAVRTAGKVEVNVAGVHECFVVTETATQDIAGFALAPGDEAIYAQLNFLYNRSPDEIDPADDGLSVMEVLRRCPVKFANGAITPAAGGHVQLTTVRRNEITTRIIKRWPDRAGAPILA